MRVFKYPFSPTDVFTIEMPQGAEVLHVDMQNQTPCIWAKVDPDAPTVNRRFRMAGTGYDLGDVAAHVGTIFMADGNLVFHLFEID